MDVDGGAVAVMECGAVDVNVAVGGVVDDVDMDVDVDDGVVDDVDGIGAVDVDGGVVDVYGAPTWTN